MSNAYLREQSPSLFVRHFLLDLVNALQGVHGLVQQERSVIHQHIDELDELLA